MAVKLPRRPGHNTSQVISQIKGYDKLFQSLMQHLSRQKGCLAHYLSSVISSEFGNMHRSSSTVSSESSTCTASEDVHFQKGFLSIITNLK